MTIIGNTNIGGLPLNLGWLGIAICSVEYNVEKTLAGGNYQIYFRAGYFFTTVLWASWRALIL